MEPIQNTSGPRHRSARPRLSATDEADRHDAAVARTLMEAEDAAVDGDYAAALSWLRMIEAIGDEIPDAYEAKRAAWLAAIDFGLTDGASRT